MGEDRPLAGRRVVVTRAAEQASTLAQRLEQAGAKVLLLPAVQYAAPLDSRELLEAIARLADFDWLIFTSQNAVRFFEAARRGFTKSPESKQEKRPRVAAVGSATAAQAEEAGWKVDFISSRFEGRTLAAELGPRIEGCEVLLPRSDRARRDLPAALRERGARVTEVSTYRTLDADMEGSAVMQDIRAGNVDLVAFASPSAFHSFRQAIGAGVMQKLTDRIAVAAIGPVTAEAIRSEGIPVAAVAEESTAAGLADAIVSYFESRATSGASGR